MSEIDLNQNKRPEFQSFKLSNGIRVVHKYNNSPVAYLGVTINTGSRDELPDELGLAHFIEHVLFKGTAKRSSYQINSRLEDVGGELNAFTTKEDTCVHATFLKEHYKRAIELLDDILFNSTFPDDELKKEKTIVVDEINSYKDNPSELIFDDFENLLFEGHPLGRHILGTPASLKKFDSAKVKQFIARNYNTDHIVISSVGRIQFDRLLSLLDQYFGQRLENLRTATRQISPSYIPKNKTIKKGTYQAHCVIGRTSYTYFDERRTAMILLCNILGGMGANSLLNQTLREQNGLSYSVESSFNAYSDTGTFTIYFGTDKDNVDRCIELVHEVLNKLRTEPLKESELKKAKKQMIGQIAIASESKEGLMLSMGKSYLVYNKVESLSEVNQKINEITAGELFEIAKEMLDPEQLSCLIFA